MTQRPNNPLTLEQQTILGVIRGERHCSDLQKLEISFEPQADGGVQVTNPNNYSIIAKPEDVAAGFLKYWLDPIQLQEWSSMILTGSSFIDLSKEFETDRSGEVLLNALWDASFMSEISQEVFDVAERLLKPG